jgi:import inner membrane translocase subunit TIM23
MSLDWLLGKRPVSSSSPSPSQQSSSSSQSSQSSASSPFAYSSQRTFEAPSVESILKPTDPARLHPLANLDKEDLEYIILEDEQIKSAGALPSRGWTDDLCYGTGATYLTGQKQSPPKSIIIF